MRKPLILIIFLFVAAVCRAQSRHTITAIIIDSASHEPVELATVVVLKVADSSLISYTITDKQGAFSLRNLRDNEPTQLLITHVGYKSLHIKLKYTNTMLLDLGKLHLTAKILSEVTVKGEIVPVVIKKDTIEFNAEAFKVRPNAVVQDLLKKLPGVQVDRDGTITVNGKDVSKVKVDGRDFFASDPKIATQNLDADMIAKVQIYDDRENDPDHLVPENQVNKIINLKFKKAFSKSTFGKVVVGEGTNDRHNLDGLYNQNINNLQVSVIANSKNLGSTEFIGTGLAGFGPSSGNQQNSTAGVNINDNFGKNVELNLVYNYENRVLDNAQTVNSAQFLNDTTLMNNTTNKSHSGFRNNSLVGTLKWKIDSLTTLNYNPHVSFFNNNSSNYGNGTSFNNFTPLLSKSVDSGSNKGNNTQYQHNINYYHAFKKKGESVNIINSVFVSPNKSADISKEDLISYTPGLASDTLNRLANNKNNNASVNLSGGYNYPLSKTLTAVITLTSNYTSNGQDLFTYQLDPKTGLYNVFLTSQSSSLTRNEWMESEHPQLVYHGNKVQLTIGMVTTSQQINNQFNNNTPNLKQHFNYLFPELSLNINSVNFNYSEDVRQPSINELQPVIMVYTPLYSYKGNPNLKPTRTRNFSLAYNQFNDNGLYMFLSSRFIIETNSITQATTVSPQGAELSTPINKNGRFTTYIGGSISKSFKKSGQWQIREQTNINGSAGRNFFETNGQQGYQDTFALPVTETLTINWNDIVDFEPSYYINPAITRYELVKYPGVSYVQQTISLPVDVQWPKHINWSVNYTHIYNPLVATGFQQQSNLVSFSVARSFQKKDKGELRLTCYDLFNQSVSAYHYASNNTINDIQSQTLRRYFLLTYSYRFDQTK